MTLITRRTLVTGGALGAGLLLSGCDKLAQQPGFRRILFSGEKINMGLQRALMDRNALAPEFTAEQMSPVFRTNGNSNPGTPDYNRHVAENFANWRLRIDGMVARPLSLSVAEIRKLPARTQITRHDCVEGWSAIGQWTGVPLSVLLRAAGLQVGARYAVFHCADNLEGEPSKGGEQSPGQYYESIGLVDALHPQTLIAYNLNGRPLDIAHGAPLRLRVERQLGYKHAKYVERIEITDDFSKIAGGYGGYWEDRGYEWYAGI